MTFLTELQTESVTLHKELENLTELSRSFDGEFFDMILVRKEYLKARIEENLDLQSKYWWTDLSEIEAVRLFFDNPGITQSELARKCNMTSTVVSRLLTNTFKKQGYGENRLRA